MTKLFIFLFTFLTLHFSFAQKKQEMIHMKSQNDFNTTVNLLYQTLEEKELTVFAPDSSWQPHRARPQPQRCGHLTG